MSVEPKATPDGERGLLPLVVGLVGRCDPPANRQHLEDQIKKILLTGIKKQYPKTPVILLSTLADGANRCAADFAMKCGVELVAALPVPRKHYEPEFIDWLRNHSVRWLDISLTPGLTDSDIQNKPGKARTLQNLIADAYVARYCDILIALQHESEQNSHPAVSIDRIIEFKLNGRFERGGRLEFDKELQSHLDKIPEPYWIRRSALYPPENGPVYHIVISNDNPSKAALRLPEEFDNDQSKGEAFYARMQRHVETLNAHALAIGDDPNQVKYRDESSEWLLTNAEANELTDALQEMRHCYHTADTLSMHFQGKTTRTLRGLCILAFLAAGSFIAYAHLLIHEAAPWPLAIYFLAVAIAFRYYINARRLDCQNKYQDYRAIAEGLRVQFFWRLAGLDSSAAEYYLLKQTSELDWIRNVIRACGLRADPAGKDKIPLVLMRWVKDQESFYSRKAPANRKELIVYRYIGEGFLGVSLLLAICVLITFLFTEFTNVLGVSSSSHSDGFSLTIAVLTLGVLVYFLYYLIGQIREQHKNLHEEALPKEETGEETDVASRPLDALKREIGKLTVKPIHNLMLGAAGGLLLVGLIFAVPNAVPFWSLIKLKIEAAEFLISAIGMTAVVGGLLHYYADKRAFSEHAKQYNRMAIIFKNAAERLSRFRYPEDYEEAASLIKELGIEALAENGDWVLLHRERPLEPVRSMEG